jgi:hypothetical protein
VQTSTYSELAGVPVALIGLVAYVAIMASLLAPENEMTRLATVAFTVVGFGFSAYLTYRELFSIHAVCEWCVPSAIVMTLLMCLAIWRFLSGDVAAKGAAVPVQRARPSRRHRWASFARSPLLASLPDARQRISWPFGRVGARRAGGAGRGARGGCGACAVTRRFTGRARDRRIWLTQRSTDEPVAAFHAA